MKTNLTIFTLWLMILGGCSTPGFLPRNSQIEINQYGGYIQINRNIGPDLNGELIAIDSSMIVVLAEGNSKCETVFLKDIKNWKLRYAKPVHYGWLIPSFILLLPIHGHLSKYTMPAHLLASIGVTVSGEGDFVYTKQNMTLEELKMFARFPQGIPKHISIKMIK